MYGQSSRLSQNISFTRLMLCRGGDAPPAGQYDSIRAGRAPIGRPYNCLLSHDMLFYDSPAKRTI